MNGRRRDAEAALDVDFGGRPEVDARVIPTRVTSDSFVNRAAAFDVIQGGERKRFAMRGIALRSDFDALKLRAVARASKNGAQTRRLLALAAIYDGATRSEAAKLAGVTLQIVRDWVVRFNAEGPDGLIDRTSPGRTPGKMPSPKSSRNISASMCS